VSSFRPLISILTPTFNRANFLKEAIESVLNQNCAAEHVIIDGGSTDGTLDLLAHYKHLSVMSEPDAGMYDALNKGIARSTGEIVGFLNSDDLFEAKSFESALEAFKAEPRAEAVTGKAVTFEDGRSGRRILKMLPAVNSHDIARQLTIGVPIINAWFFRRSVIDRIGAFDLNFRISADRDFLIRCYQHEITIHSVNRVFYQYRQHAGSQTINQNLAIQQKYLFENLVMASKYADSPLSSIVLKKLAHQWRDLTYLDLMITFLLRRKPGTAFCFGFEAIKQNPAWGMSVCKNSITRAKKYLTR
jgi:glycosyltransferase involved in cell wall biosynthesis